MDREFKIIDLTHTLSSEIPTWDGSCGFELEVKTDYGDCTPPDIFRVQKITCNAGIGTHIDAPAHVILGGRTVENLGLEELITDCIVIDVSSEADENYVIMPSAIEKFEKEYGEIKESSFVIFYTGWDKYWEDKTKYIHNYKFPSVDPTTAELLVKRNIAGLGTDTLSVDTGKNGFPVHRIILGTNKYLVENIANAKSLPPLGVKIVILPMKIKDGTEAPVRMIGLI